MMNAFDNEPVANMLAAAQSTMEEFGILLNIIRDQAVIPANALDHLPAGRVPLMQEAIRLTTFQMQIRGELALTAHFIRDGNAMHDPIQINTREKCASANVLQMASVVVESINLVLNIIGQQYPAERIMKVIDYVTSIIHGEKYKAFTGKIAGIRKIEDQRMVENMIKLVVSAFEYGILLNIIRNYYDPPNGFPQADWLRISTKIIFFVGMVIGKPNRCAEIARIVGLEGENHVDFFQNLRNVQNYDMMMQQALGM